MFNKKNPEFFECVAWIQLPYQTNDSTIVEPLALQLASTPSYRRPIFLCHHRRIPPIPRPCTSRFRSTSRACVPVARSWSWHLVTEVCDRPAAVWPRTLRPSHSDASTSRPLDFRSYQRYNISYTSPEDWVAPLDGSFAIPASQRLRISAARHRGSLLSDSSPVSSPLSRPTYGDIWKQYYSLEIDLYKAYFW